MSCIRVRFIHPATGAETERELPLLCSLCVRSFEPSDDDAQLNVGDPVSVHCTRCGALALQWTPPPPAPPPEPEPEPEPQ